ncbi:YafY family transcriptional regulator [Hyphomonas sp. WL0036]|uniref:helix-turn-helix transcriptional regulator n=1 Tax=Hyphomonas sediminis TaxID=2866160 RepID=UPI001C7F1F88|nr:YafY family protein [Hyphomonas sediminis]MBY9067923.1 YafY family transcriptional regulator [Hyphomonas sediminis]
MARTDRLFRLLHLMRTLPQPVTAARLAQETEVSERAIYRDIGALRAAGARIEGEAGYGYVLAEDPALPPQSFTRIEIEALMIGLAEARNSGDQQIAEAAQKALAKVIATLPERQQREATHAVHFVFRGNRREVPARDLALIRAACWEEEALRLSYRDEAGAATERIVLPLTILYAEKVLVLLAWCRLRDDWRSFRIDRIAAAEKTGESFRPRRVGLLRDYIARMEARRGN